MATALVLSFSDLSRDPRVHRQIRALAARYAVTAAGFGAPGIEGVAYVPIERTRKPLTARLWSAVQLLAGAHEAYYWRLAHVQSCLVRLADLRADVVVANDIDTLPVALRLADGARVVFDAHEYAPRQFEDRLFFRLFFQSYITGLCKRYIPEADGMMTVSAAIAREYEKETGVKPRLITNAPDFEVLEPQPVNDGRIRLVHHGGAIPSRRIENMIRMMALLDERFELDLLFAGGSERYLRRLMRMAEGDPRIRFVPPVPMPELPRFLNRYDIGVYILEPANFNARFALPNKLFEFVQARLAVAIGPSPEMARIVREHDCGVVASDFSPRSLAACLMDLDARRIARYKRRSHEVARLLSAEPNREKLLGLVSNVLGEASGPA